MVFPEFFSWIHSSSILTTQTEYVVLSSDYNYLMLLRQLIPHKSVLKNVLCMNGTPQITLANWNLCNRSSHTRLIVFYFLLH